MDQVGLGRLLQALYRRLLPPELHPRRMTEEKYLSHQPCEWRLPDEEVRGALVVPYLLQRQDPRPMPRSGRSRLLPRPRPAGRCCRASDLRVHSGHAPVTNGLASELPVFPWSCLFPSSALFLPELFLSELLLSLAHGGVRNSGDTHVRWMQPPPFFLDGRDPNRPIRLPVYRANRRAPKQQKRMRTLRSGQR